MTGPLVVGYDRGAASAAEIAVGLREFGPLVFLVAPSRHTRQVGEVLRRLGQVIPVTGDRRDALAAVRRLGPSAILTFSEPMLPLVGWLADALDLPGHPLTSLGPLTDKVRQRARLREHGVDDVRSQPITSVEDWPKARDLVGLPAVIKPVHGQGSRDTHVVTSDPQARQVLTPLLPPDRTATVLVEELLTGRPSGPFGDYVSVESYHGPQGVYHLAVTGKLPLVAPFRETGRFWPAALTPTERQEILDLTTRALTALEVGPGLTHTEIKLTAYGPRIIEVNGRLGGHVNGLARQVAGLDLVRLAGCLALGRPVTPPAVDQPDTVYFQHNTLAPVRSCELLALPDPAAVRRLDGVDGYRSYARVGDLFDTDVATRHLDLLWGHCPGHTDLADLLDETRRHLGYEFRFGDVVRRLTAADLHRR